MQFCPKCNNSYTISKLNVGMKMNEDTPSSMSSMSDNSSSSPDDDQISHYDDKSKKSIKDKEKEKENEAMAKFKIENFDMKKAFFKCTNCGNNEPIKSGQLILSRMAIGKNADYFDQEKMRIMMYDKTLPHTRNYICRNKECKSHNDYALRDAVFFKPSKNSYITKYVCTACETIW